jgi:hypothetical protein
MALSTSIRKNSAEEALLEKRIHERLEEVWEPSDGTLAKYAAAMVAKGHDRKKIHTQLKAILPVRPCQRIERRAESSFVGRAGCRGRFGA